MDDEDLRNGVLDVLQPRPEELVPTNFVTVREYVATAQAVVGEMTRRLRMK